MTKEGNDILSRGQDVLKNKPKKPQRNKERQHIVKGSACRCQQDLILAPGVGDEAVDKVEELPEMIPHNNQTADCFSSRTLHF